LSESKVYSKTSASESWNAVSVAASTLSYTVNGLAEDTDYDFRVAAVNPAGEGTAAEIKVKTNKTVVIPDTEPEPKPEPEPEPKPEPKPEPEPEMNYPDVASIKSPLAKFSLVINKQLNLKGMVGLYDSKSLPVSDPELTWTSSKPNIATVSASGAVKAGKKPGNTVITVKAQNGKSLKITVNIVKKATKVKKISGKVPALKVGKPVFITLKGVGTNITGCKWKVSGKGLKIDKFGMATPTKAGKYTITVTAGGKKWVKKVTVKK
jgi:hypothetical protein